MVVIIKILYTLLVILMFRIIIRDTIKYIKERKYTYAFIGIILTIYLIFCEYNMVTSME